MSDLDSLQDILDIRFNDVAIATQALTHSSYINENPGLESNERLEFLGDAVLGLVVAQTLYENFPDLEEGDLTKLRAAVVRRDALSRLAETIHLGEYLLLGKGEEAGGGRDKSLNLAGALEAVIGAIYLDRGEDVARRFILHLIEDELKQVLSRQGETDYKTELQEVMQSRRHITPTYRLVEATGPDRCRVFTVEVLSGVTVMGVGSGRNKKAAEREAAHAALAQISGQAS